MNVCEKIGFTAGIFGLATGIPPACCVLVASIYCFAGWIGAW